MQLIYNMLKIKEIRTSKKITQEAISEAIGISKRSFIDYESGKTDIPIGKLQNIATFMNVSVNDLLDIQTNEISIVAEPTPKYHNSPQVITVDSHNEDNIVLVPMKAKAGYLKGWSDPDFIKKLPTFRMPGLNNGVFRMFEVNGNSMFPTIPDRSFVVGSFVENWVTGIKDNQIYVIVSNKIEDGLVKRCINKIAKYNNLICKSDNRREYPTQNIDPDDILEVWEVKLHLNFNIPDPANIYDRVNDLEGELISLQQIIKKAKLLP